MWIPLDITTFTGVEGWKRRRLGRARGADGFGFCRESDAVAQSCGERVAEWGSGVLPGPAAVFADGGPSPDDTVPALPRPTASKTRRQATSGGVGEEAAGEKGSGVVAETSGVRVGVGGGTLEKFLMKIPARNKIFLRWRPRDKYWFHVELTLDAIALALCIAQGQGGRPFARTFQL